MTPHEADTLIIEFARTIGADRVLVIGSQAFHAHFAGASAKVVEDSREIDLIPLPADHFDRWFFHVHEHLGADSDFDLEHGVYVDMVKAHVPKLPAGWEKRTMKRTLEVSPGKRVTVLYPDI